MSKPMSKVDRHRIVCYISYLASVLNLHDYDIVLHTEYEKDDLASTTVAFGRHTAIIAVHKKFHTWGTVAQTHVLLHEMLHIPTDAIMREALMPKGNRKRLREAHEQLVDRLAITYRPLVQPFPGPAYPQSPRVHDGGLGW